MSTGSLVSSPVNSSSLSVSLSRALERTFISAELYHPQHRIPPPPQPITFVNKSGHFPAHLSFDPSLVCVVCLWCVFVCKVVSKARIVSPLIVRVQCCFSQSSNHFHLFCVRLPSAQQSVTMLKLSIAVLLFVGVASANPLQGSIKGYGLVSPISKHRSAVAGAIPQQVAPSYPSGPISTKGGSKTNIPSYRPRPATKVGPVTAAVITSRAQEVINVPISEDVITPQVVIIEPNLTPVTIEFRSRSSPVNIQQVHIPGPRGQTKTTRSQEQPDRVIHEVVKPVIQEVREIIQPFRKITQQILPVQEEVLSVVSKGERKQTIEQVEVPKVEIPEEPVAEVQQDEQIEAESAPAQQLYGSGTIVQAGLIGGARILPAEDSAALLGSVNNRPNKGLKVARR